MHDLLEDPRCPVAVAPRGYSDHPGALERIGVASDETPESDQALAVARKLAARSHASLSAYDAIGRPVYARDIWNVEREVDQAVRQARQRIAALGGLAAFADVADDAVEGLDGMERAWICCCSANTSTTHRTGCGRAAPRTASLTPSGAALVLAQAQAGSQGRTSRKRDDGGSPVGARSSRGEDSTGDSSFVLTHPRTIESDVRDALQRDARIKRPELIAISVDMIGTVVLGGTVATIRQRRAAVHDARRIDGVFEVIDHLRVHPPVGPLRTDDEIRAAALRRLNGDSRIHAEQIRVKVAARPRDVSPDTSGTHPSGCTPKKPSRAWTTWLTWLTRSTRSTSDRPAGQASLRVRSRVSPRGRLSITRTA